MLSYEGIGISGVCLVNGYERKQTAYGPGVAIQDIDGLHRALCRWLLYRRERLTGAELAFLREELDLTEEMIATLIGKSSAVVRRWEDKEHAQIDRTADRLVRLLCLESLFPGESGLKLLEEISTPNKRVALSGPIYFARTNGDWQKTEKEELSSPQ